MSWWLGYVLVCGSMLDVLVALHKMHNQIMMIITIIIF